MPTYEYICDKCGKNKEIRIIHYRISGNDETFQYIECECGGKLEKQFSPTKNIIATNGKYTSKNNYGLK